MAKTPEARFSAAWFWAGAKLALATTALLEGIDHGFVEPAGLYRYLIQRQNWIAVGVATACMLLATSRPFLAWSWQGPVLAVAATQLIVDTMLALGTDDFTIVFANYLPVMPLLLVLSVPATRHAGLRGRWWAASCSSLGTGRVGRRPLLKANGRSE